MHNVLKANDIIPSTDIEMLVKEMVLRQRNIRKDETTNIVLSVWREDKSKVIAFVIPLVKSGMYAL